MKDVYEIALTDGRRVEVKAPVSPALAIEFGHAYMGELVEEGRVVAYHFYVNPQHIVTVVKKP